ncbi:hypothetical protein [Metabacillus sp. RGM 3146]|uniref:hypothetical protein n=1 Tax=Metabacillus sp. RGM 3146 TaxID=3401092 RepID=UPI003B9D747D
MSTEKRDHLYEYVLYFWRKKWLLIGIPVVVALLAFGLSQVTSKGYHGEATFSTGKITLASLADPELLQANYSKEFGNKLTVEPMEKSKVKFTVDAKDKATADSILNKASAKYIKALQDNYSFRKKLTEEGLAGNKKMLAKATKTYNEIQPKLLTDGPNMPPEQYALLAEAVTKTEKLISDKNSSIIGSTYDLEEFEKPDVMKKDVSKQSNHAKANTIIGFVFALFLTILGLMLAKYMRDAREGRRHD